MKEKHIKKLKKLLINLEAAKALTYYYAGDDYYHRLNHTDGYVPDPHPIKTKTCERILSKINKLGTTISNLFLVNKYSGPTGPDFLFSILD